MTTEKHIFISSGFDEVCVLFYNKILNFHKYFVGDLLVSSDYSEVPENDFLSIDQNNDYDDIFISDVFGELLESTPLILINHKDPSLLDFHNSVYVIYYLNQNSNTEGFYMTEGFRNNQYDLHSSYRVYQMNSNSDLKSINNFWLE